MGQIIRVKRGLKANLAEANLVAGEMAFCTDTKELFLNDGTINTLVGKYLINDAVEEGDKADYVYSASKVDTLVGAFSEGILYKGAFDASAGNFNALAGAEIGNLYVVSVTGEIGGVTYEDGDKIIFNKAASDPVVATDFDHYKGAANIDSSDISDWDDAVEARINELLSSTNTIAVTSEDESLTFDLQYESSTSVTLSESAAGLKADAIVDDTTIKIDATDGLYVHMVDGGEFDPEGE